VRPLVAFFAFGAILVQIKWTQQGKKLRFLSIWTTHNIKEGKAVATFQERKGKGGKKSFRAIVRRKGQPLQTRTFGTLKEAKQWAREVEVQIDKGKNFLTSSAKEKTVNEAIARYLETVLPYEGESSRANKKKQLQWWSEQIGHIRLSHLTRAVVVEKRDQLLVATHLSGKTQKKYKPATVNRYIDALSSVLTKAVSAWQWLETHPLRGHPVKVKENNERTRFLSMEEQERLWEACHSPSVNPIIADIILLAITTGMRKSEIRFLKWDHVSLDKGWLYVDDAKNGEKRQIPLYPQTGEMLKARFESRSEGCSWVFPSEKVEKPFDFHSLFAHVVKIANLQDFHFHDLRHTAASYLAMGGASLLDLQRILGHKTLQMVQRYAHLSNQHMATVPKKMTQYIVFKANAAGDYNDAK
jgi:integrase